MSDVWFWQRIVSPHMARLASEMAALGHEVTYVAEEEMSEDRRALGWQAPQIEPAVLKFASSADAMKDMAASAPENSIHICQGFRGNGLINVARSELARRRLRQWVIMETVEENGRLMSWLKRLEYRRQIGIWKKRIEGVLAIGHSTPEWLAKRGMERERIFPFSYFLPFASPSREDNDRSSVFRFLYIGQFIELKRIELLLEALSTLVAHDFEIMLVGNGPEEQSLRQQADKLLKGRAIWAGTQPMAEIPYIMASADCLILPSRHDGWGAVVSEALMAGTPAICSDRCGVAGIVEASGCGGVFPSGDLSRLTELLQQALERGPLGNEERERLCHWASCLNAASGAKYLDTILTFRNGDGERPTPPWAEPEGRFS